MDRRIQEGFITDRIEGHAVRATGSHIRIVGELMICDDTMEVVLDCR